MAVKDKTIDDEVLSEDIAVPTEDQPSNVPSDAELLKIVNQVESEYQVAWENLEEWRAKQLKRLKLYNNQKRDQSKVGDPLLFTVFNTVIAALYSDKLTPIFAGREEGDDEAAENLTSNAEYDYELMGKDEMDYEWIFDTGFFGRGLLLLDEFDREQMCPQGEVMDPLTFLRDPNATSVNGNQKGHGALRFWGREIGLSKSQMRQHPAYFNVDNVKKDKDLKNIKDEAKTGRDEAQGRGNSNVKEEALKGNYEYNLLEWWTVRRGKKVLITLANNRQTVVRYQILKSASGSTQSSKVLWPVIDRVLFPMSHDWDGVSIPDLIEDKQRARSVMINLGMESAKADLYPMYLFDKKKIKNPNDLNFEFNKYVPVNGPVDNAVVPIQKSVFHQQVNLILNILDVAAQKSVAAPEVSQGVQPQQNRTLGETQLVESGADTRHSLAAKIFGWSEKRFWRQWYILYKTYFKADIDKKTIRLQGPLAPVWRELTRENLVTDVDPDVKIESQQEAKAKRQEEFSAFSQFFQIAAQDPGTNRRYGLRKMGQIMGMKKSTLTLFFPPNIDELRAEDENAKIAKNVLPEVKAADEDICHIEIHNKAEDTPAKLAHIEAHKAMMMFKKEHPELFPPPQALPITPIATPASGGAPGQGQQTSRGAPAPARSSSYNNLPTG